MLEVFKVAEMMGGEGDWYMTQDSTSYRRVGNSTLEIYSLGLFIGFC